MALLYRVEMMGRLRVRHEDRLITHFRTRKTGELLAYLACAAGRAYTREHLLELFFPDLDLDAARNNLSQILGFLRRQFQTSSEPHDSLFLVDRVAIAINPHALTTDLSDFEALLAEAQRALSERTHIQLLTDALALYEGPFLPEVFADWALRERERLAQRWLQALRTLVRLLAKTGETERALTAAQEVVAADPLLEEAHRGLMRLYVATGQPTSALRQYQELEQRLRSELGILPSPATQQLLAQIQERLGTLPTPATDAPVITADPPPAEATSMQDARSMPRALILTAPPSSGTLTFLLLDFADRDFADAERTPALSLSERVSGEVMVRLRAEIRRHGGGEMRAKEHLLAAAFGRAGDAGLCALAIQERFSGRDGLQEPGSEQRGLEEPQREEAGWEEPRLALDTREIRLKDGEEPASILEFAVRLLAAMHPGQIACGESTAVLLRREPEEWLQVQDLGRYRLQEHEAAQRVFQLSERETLRSFPALRAVAEDRVSLPTAVTRFFGREAEIEQVLALLSDANVRLVTLLGPGGTGKTRLALEAVGRYGRDERRPTWWVDLSSVSDPLLVPSALVSALGLPRSPLRSDLELVLEAVRSQPMLLVLDNFEQLVEGGGAETLGTLLRSSSTLQMLVTSRVALELSAERRLEVLPLSLPNVSSAPGNKRSVLAFPPAGRLAADLAAGSFTARFDEATAISASLSPAPSSLSSAPSVALFVDRVQAVRPDFHLGAHNAEAVAALCTRLEGIPLAIELAAARAQMLSPAQMLEQLEDRFAFLVSRQRDLPSRHRTLRATLDFSYRLLSPEQQLLFSRLSVFRGGWDVEAAAAVCEGSGDVMEGLEQLRNHSLIIVEEMPNGMRFRMLETVREYAAEVLAGSGEEERIKEGHLEHFLALTENVSKDSYRAEGCTWWERLELEYDNVRSAFAWISTRKINADLVAHTSADSGLRLCFALQSFWRFRGYHAEGRGWCAAALTAERVSGRTAIRGRASNVGGLLAFDQGDHAVARDYFEESRAIYLDLKDRAGIATAHYYLGLIAQGQGDCIGAQALHEEGLTLSLELGDRRGVGLALHGLGLAAYEQGDFSSARDRFEECLAIFRELKHKQSVVSALLRLGNLAQIQRDYSAAQTYGEESLAISREIGDKVYIASSLQLLGSTAYFQGDCQSARRLCEEALTTQRELGHKLSVAGTLGDLGLVAQAEGKLDEARTLYIENLIIRREYGHKQYIAFGLDKLAGLAFQQNRLVRAVRIWSAAEALLEQVGAAVASIRLEQHKRDAAEARRTMGEAEWTAAWDHGHAMSPEQAIDYAMKEEQPEIP